MASDIVGSNAPTFASDALRPSRRGYGQNGYAGASSDMPGQNTTSGFLPGCDYQKAAQNKQDFRTLPAGNVPTAFGMKERTKEMALVDNTAGPARSSVRSK